MRHIFSLFLSVLLAVLLLSGCVKSPSVNSFAAPDFNLGSITLHVPSGCTVQTLDSDRVALTSSDYGQIIVGRIPVDNDVQSLGKAFQILKPVLAVNVNGTNRACYSSIHAIKDLYYMMSQSDSTVRLEHTGDASISSLAVIRDKDIYFLVSASPVDDHSRIDKAVSALADEFTCALAGSGDGGVLFANTFGSFDGTLAANPMIRRENCHDEILQYAADLSDGKVDNSVISDESCTAVLAFLETEEFVDSSPASSPSVSASSVRPYLLESSEEGSHVIVGRDIEAGDYIGSVRSGSGSIKIVRNGSVAAGRLLGYGTTNSIDRGSFGLMDGDELILISKNNMTLLFERQ